MIVTDFPAGWYVLFALGAALWLFFSWARKSVRNNIIFGFIGMAIAFAAELIGIALGLWSYAGGNWPAILWPTYFVFSMAGYQIFRLAEERLEK